MIHKSYSWLMLTIHIFLQHVFFTLLFDSLIRNDNYQQTLKWRFLGRLF